jgi:hypothetical protein
MTMTAVQEEAHYAERNRNRRKAFEKPPKLSSSQQKVRLAEAAAMEARIEPGRARG